MSFEPGTAAIASLARRLLLRLSRCAKACFLEGDGKTVTPEGGRVLADLATFARLDPARQQHAFLRDRNLTIDPLSMARIEGRREVVWRLQRLLNLNEAAMQNLVETANE